MVQNDGGELKRGSIRFGWNRVFDAGFGDDRFFSFHSGVVVADDYIIGEFVVGFKEGLLYEKNIDVVVGKELDGFLFLTGDAIHVP